MSWEREGEFRSLLRRLAMHPSQDSMEVLTTMAMQDHKHAYKAVTALVVREIRRQPPKQRAIFLYLISHLIRTSVQRLGKGNRYVERFTPYLEEAFGLAREGGPSVQDKLVDILKRWWMEDIVDGTLITQLQACVARRQDAAETIASTHSQKQETITPPSEQAAHVLSDTITNERSSSSHDPAAAGRPDSTASIVMSRIPGPHFAGDLRLQGAVDPRRRPPLVAGGTGTEPSACPHDQGVDPPSTQPPPSSVKRGILKSSIQVQPNDGGQAPCQDNKRPRIEVSRPLTHSSLLSPPVSPVTAALEAVPPMSPVSATLAAVSPLPMDW